MLPHDISISLSIFLLPLITTAQLLQTLAPCIQTCITQSQSSYTSCSLNTINCLCYASSSSSSYLTDLVSCIDTSCSNSLDASLLLTPLQLACQIEGVPIPGSVLSAAESVATQTGTGPGSGSGNTATRSPTPIPTTETPPQESTTQSPVVETITTTNSVGSTYTSPISNPGTSSDTQTSWVPPTVISGSSTSIDSTGGGTSTSTSTSTSTVVPEETTSTSTSRSASASGSRGIKPSTSSSKSPPKQTDSAPFTDTNNSGAMKLGGGQLSWCWSIVVGAVYLVWTW